MAWFARALLLFAINAIAFLFGRSVAMRYRRRVDPWADEELAQETDDAPKAGAAPPLGVERSAPRGKAQS
jgi:hypothetical protein